MPLPPPARVRVLGAAVQRLAGLLKIAADTRPLDMAVYDFLGEGKPSIDSYVNGGNIDFVGLQTSPLQLPALAPVQQR